MRHPLTHNGFNQLKSGHPWLLKSHFLKSFKIPTAPCLYPLGEHWFWVSPKSEICFRRLGPASRYWPSEVFHPEDLSFDRQPVFTLTDFEHMFLDPLGDLITQTFRLKQSLLPSEKCFRWIFSENDLIPGLIADLYEQDIVVQILTAPVEFFWPVIQKILIRSLTLATQKPAGGFRILEQRHNPIRKQEGLDIQNAISVEPKAIQWNGLRWLMTPGSSHQKTGAYLDQRNNHLTTLKWATHLHLKSAWDLFSFEGGFGLHLAKHGLSILSVDISARAQQTAQKNAELNNIPPQLFCIQEADVFDFLTHQHKQKAKTDLIILDPPPFSKQISNRTSALKGYKDLNLRALHCLNTPGLLVTCSCSYHINPADFYQMLIQAAHDARRSVKVLEMCGPSPDHAFHLSFPEGRYLQAWFLLVT